MDESIQQALERDRTIDITTTGRKTGQPRRTDGERKSRRNNIACKNNMSPLAKLARQLRCAALRSRDRGRRKDGTGLDGIGY
jgi:hypothetical protein